VEKRFKRRDDETNVIAFSRYYRRLFDMISSVHRINVAVE
jgi:hypothetical protein